MAFKTIVLVLILSVTSFRCKRVVDFIVCAYIHPTKGYQKIYCLEEYKNYCCYEHNDDHSHRKNSSFCSRFCRLTAINSKTRRISRNRELYLVIVLNESPSNDQRLNWRQFSLNSVESRLSIASNNMWHVLWFKKAWLSIESDQWRIIRIGICWHKAFLPSQGDHQTMSPNMVFELSSKQVSIILNENYVDFR